MSVAPIIQLPICALAGACRARAYAKAMGLKTWLRNTVLQPFRSRNWTWCSGVPRWIKHFALPNASTFIQTAYLGAGWQALDPAVLVEVVKACIMARECKLRRKVMRLMVAQTVWYEAANFGKTPLTRMLGGGKPQDQAGFALILWCRIGAFVTILTLVRWKRVLQRYLDKCPFCRREDPETLEHLVFRCGKWRGLRNEPHMAELITEVRGLGPDSALGIGQQHLAWLLGGRHANCGVH
jgi:hypothetical protein